MKLVVFRDFRGEIPRLSPRKLPPGHAQRAAQVVLEDGKLRPAKMPLEYTAVTLFPTSPALSGITTAYRFDDGSGLTAVWLAWTEEVQIARSPVAATSGRLYWTGDFSSDEWPRCSDRAELTGGADSNNPANNYFRMGVPAPAAAPTLAAAGTASTTDESLFETRYYLYTYVTPWGEEGPPSPVSAAHTWKPGETVDIASMSTGPGADYNVSGMTKRIYRSSAGTDGAAFLFVAEIAVADTTDNDAVATGALGEQLPSENFTPPPADMRGIINASDGVLAGFSGNTLCLSEPFQPHAWPADYQYSIPHNIVALGAVQGELYVLTDQIPYRVTGTDPATVRITPINNGFECVSARSVVSIEDVGCLYASRHGIARVSQGGAFSLLSEPLIAPEDFYNNWSPASIVAWSFTNKYVFTHDGDTMWIMDPRDDLQMGLVRRVRLELSGAVTAGFDPRRGYFVAVDNDKPYFYELAGEDDDTAWAWWSPEIDLTGLQTLTCGRVIFDRDITPRDIRIGVTYRNSDGDYGNVTYTLVGADGLFRLPRTERGVSFYIQVSRDPSDSAGVQPVIEEIRLATNMNELMRA